MKLKQTAQQKAKTDKAFEGKKLKPDMAKNAVIIIRATQADKDDMQKTAKRLGMSLTEMLTRLYALAKPQLK
jgi:transcriptional regulator with PAS, ATPase and Fis domain